MVVFSSMTPDKRIEIIGVFWFVFGFIREVVSFENCAFCLVAIVEGIELK